MQSSVAGIIDPKGGLRVVVADKKTFWCHVYPGELLFIVPRYKVTEPVPWEDIPSVIAKVEEYVRWWITTRNDPDLEQGVALYKRKHLCSIT